jgi:hypothetical protein
MSKIRTKKKRRVQEIGMKVGEYKKKLLKNFTGAFTIV